MFCFYRSRVRLWCHLWAGYRDATSKRRTMQQSFENALKQRASSTNLQDTQTLSCGATERSRDSRRNRPLTHSHQSANPAERTTWSSLDRALTAVATGKFQGIGFMLSRIASASFLYLLAYEAEDIPPRSCGADQRISPPRVLVCRFPTNHVSGISFVYCL